MGLASRGAVRIAASILAWGSLWAQSASAADGGAPSPTPTQGIISPELVDIQPIDPKAIPAAARAKASSPLLRLDPSAEKPAPSVKTALPKVSNIPAIAQKIERLAPPTLEEIAVLSAKDASLYKRIFAVQEKGDWKTANALVKQVSDDLLMGHVRFQRYMHPTAYRSQFSELDRWMERYSDHPEAARIFKLANRRKPNAAGAPPRPERKSWRYGKREVSAFDAHNPKRSRAQRREAARIERYVRSLLRKERPTQSLNYVSQQKVRNRLTRVEFDRIRQWIATSYYMEQVDEKAFALAKDVAARNRKAVPHADWIAGLAAWRLGKVETAAKHFETMAKAEHVNEWDRSATAFWAARSYMAIRQPQKIVPLLRIASKGGLSFYALLARRQLGQPIIPDWEPPAPDTKLHADMLKVPHVRRAIALAQAGEWRRAEQELTWAHGLLENEHDPALMRVASALKIPSVEYKIAMSRGDNALQAGLFPLPGFAPKSGFKLDRALLFSIIRKESKFLTAAMSHAGARGLMQIMPITAIDVTKDRSFKWSKAKQESLFDPAVNLDLGQSYAARLLGGMEPKGNLLKFLTAYNAGPGNLRRWLRTVKFQDDALLFVESLPVPETRSYVEKVLAAYWIYRARLGQDLPSLDAMVKGDWPIYKHQDDPDRLDQFASLDGD